MERCGPPAVTRVAPIGGASLKGLHMAKTEPAALVKVAADVNGSGKDVEIRFGKTDKILKFPFPYGAAEPTGVLFVAKSGRTYVADFTRYPANIKAFMVFHGTKQKLGDEYADLDSEDDCMEAMIELDGRLAEGKWTADRQGFAGISVLMRALMKVYAIEEAAAREFLKPLSVKEKQALRASDELKATIQELEAEKGKGVDTKAILGKLKAA